MARFLVFCLGALSLIGCSGGEFTAAETTFSAAGTAASAGEAGETSVGGADGPGSGGSDNEGGNAAGADTGGSGGLGGSSTAGDTSMGGSTAGSGGVPPTAGTQNGGSGGTPPVMVCNPKATQCADGAFQTCKNDGTAWTSTACDFVCDAQKGCGGACQPGTKQCDGLKSQTCDENGKWATSTNCAFVCGGEGVCGGQCVPGTQQCSSANAQKCSDKGLWTTTETCDFSCNFSGGQASCGGACTNGTKQCSGSVPQTCTNNEWTSGALCPFICSNGTCGGECSPGAQKCGVLGGIQTCSPEGKWLAEGSSCPFTCTNGTCGGACKPNAPCQDDGNQCTDDLCNPQGTQCLHPPKGNGAQCGSSSASVCDAADTCQGGLCQPNFKAANVACNDDQNVCTSDLCNGSGACGHAAAPAVTVCRPASCLNGTATAQATCGGATACPAAVPTVCSGACNAQANACEAAPANQIDTTAPLATDNDATYLYASERSLAGVSQIVRYQKSNNAKTVLFESVNTSEWIYALIVAGDYVYFGENFYSAGVDPTSAQVSRIATSGVKQTATAVSADATFGFAKNSARVYWSTARRQTCVCDTPPTTKIFSTVFSDKVPSVSPFGRVFNGEELSPDIEVDDDYLYVWELAITHDGPQVSQVYNPFLTKLTLADYTNNSEVIPTYFTEGSNTYTLTSTNTALPGLTKQGSTIFGNVNLNNSVSSNLILKHVGGVTTRLTKTSTVGLTFNFVADASWVYIDNQKISVGGGSMSYWTNHNLSNPSSLSGDANTLYFGSWGYWNDTPYTGNVDVQTSLLLRAAKN